MSPLSANEFRSNAPRAAILNARRLLSGHLSAARRDETITMAKIPNPIRPRFARLEIAKLCKWSALRPARFSLLASVSPIPKPNPARGLSTNRSVRNHSHTGTLPVIEAMSLISFPGSNICVISAWPEIASMARDMATPINASRWVRFAEYIANRHSPTMALIFDADDVPKTNDTTKTPYSTYHPFPRSRRPRNSTHMFVAVMRAAFPDEPRTSARTTCSTTS